MGRKRERGLRELYADDPERADAVLWNRRVTRRGLFVESGLAALTAAVATNIPFFANLPAGLVPSALADSDAPFAIEGKDGLIVLNDRPINAETPPHLLDDDITPIKHHFVRNHGTPPAEADAGDPAGWSLTVDGEVHQSLRLTLAELKQFKSYTHDLQLECGGNGRAGFQPPVRGLQWRYGAVACARWTGARLKDVLDSAGLKPSAVYTGYYGADLHLSGNPEKVTLSRGTPISKAVEEHTLLAWAMNGEPLPALHGFPVRVVTPGWPASTSAKWLKRIWVRDRVHDGAEMSAPSYRVPSHPVPPGASVPDDDMAIIHSLPVKSLITRPRTRAAISAGAPLAVRGHAWAGDRAVRAVHLSYDFGATWIETRLSAPVNRYAWQHWQTSLALPHRGYYEIWARATDDAGVMQPMLVPGWNPGGYLNNAMHRIAVTVT